MTERILVTGATGAVGREVVRLLARSGCHVRAAARDPAAVRGFFPPDIEVVELDFDRTETYDAAAQWVDRVLLMPPPFDPDAYGTIDPFLDWAVAMDTQRVVLISAMDAESNPELALRRVEQHLEGMDVAWTILRPNLYMQNFSTGFILDGIRRSGVVELCAGDGKVSFVDARDVAAVAAEALRGGHEQRAYTLTGPESMDLHEATRMLSDAAGRRIEYRAVSPDRMHRALVASGWPLRQAATVVGLYQSVANGRRARVQEDVAMVLGRAPASLRDYVRENAAAWRG
jgi:uncharacterized protein YbjT (DUF2867 family)